MIRRSLLSLLAALLMSAATVAQTPSPPNYTIVDLGKLGGTWSWGAAINEAGQVTGSASSRETTHYTITPFCGTGPP